MEEIRVGGRTVGEEVVGGGETLITGAGVAMERDVGSEEEEKGLTPDPRAGGSTGTPTTPA